MPYLESTFIDLVQDTQSGGCETQGVLVASEQPRISHVWSRPMGAADDISSVRKRDLRPIKRAPVFAQDQLDQLLAHIDATSHVPVADRAKVLLSFLGGLRIAEVHAFDFGCVTDASGKLLKYMRIVNAKTGRERVIPLHPELRQALQTFRETYPQWPCVAIAQSWLTPTSTPKRQSLNALTTYIWRLYRNAGFAKASTHSGRRTFITSLARNLGDQFSLRDVQIVAGHRRLDTTEGYIEPSGNTAALIATLGRSA